MAQSPFQEQKTSAFLFPGVNCVTREKDRRRALSLPEVSKRLSSAQEVIYGLGDKRSLQVHLERSADDICRVDNIALTAPCVAAIQLGIADSLHNRGFTPDWLLGCSLGDHARSVCAGIIDFEDLIHIQHDFFTNYCQDALQFQGLNVGIRSSSQDPFGKEDMEWFKENDIAASWMSPTYVQTACTPAVYEKLEAMAGRRSWKMEQFRFEIMFHTHQLSIFSNRVQGILDQCELRNPALPIYSSVLGKPLESTSTFVEELLTSAWNPVRWYQSVRSLVETHQVSQFINIGPCRSLSALQRSITPGNRAIDALTLIEQ